MTVKELQYPPNAAEDLQSFVDSLQDYPINKKLVPVVDAIVVRDKTTKEAFLYSFCFLVIGSRQTPFQIAEATGIPIKMVKLLVNNLNNACRKFDHIGQQYLGQLYDLNPEEADYDFRLMIEVDQYLKTGLDMRHSSK